MQSFRTEIENPLVEKDILELEEKIRKFHQGEIAEEKFRSLRLARGVYGQRQQGVQMIRIKIPYGKLTFRQLARIADISDEYSTGNLHLTTRQDIQLHYVSLDDTPELWAKLEQDEITLREACGNTVRNITASPEAGIDPEEAFDVTPYADALFRHLLRNPINQDMGRKFKIAFSATEKDTALTYIHDLGFIPKVEIVDGETVKGFKVLVGGGLGAQGFLAYAYSDFIPTEEIIPLTEAILRVFDREGERNNRRKARMKFLIKQIGFEAFVDLVEAEKAGLSATSYPIEANSIVPSFIPSVNLENGSDKPIDADLKYQEWLATNVFAQKQEGYHGVFVKIPLGDISTIKTRQFIRALNGLIGDDIRVTPNQNLLLRYVPTHHLPTVYEALSGLNLATPGYDSTLDITSCPGTDTCNLGISSSTGAVAALEDFLRKAYPNLAYERDLKIKISGCMNSCGQHGLAQIGFHGSSIKGPEGLLPALQVMLGGGTLSNGEGRLGSKVIKIPSKRVLKAVEALLDDYFDQREEEEVFNAYFDRKGDKYFYELLKPFANLKNLDLSEYIDWKQEEKFQTAIGVGECAGVVIDLVQTLLFEAEERIDWAKDSLRAKRYADAVYHTYSGQVHTAKAILLAENVKCNSQASVLKAYDEHFGSKGPLSLQNSTFEQLVLVMNKQAPTEQFANEYIAQAIKFHAEASAWRNQIQKTSKANGDVTNR